MEPSTIISGILASTKIVKAIEEFARDEIKVAAKKAAAIGAKSAIRLLTHTAREKAAREALRLFTEAWLSELKDTTPFTEAIAGYKERLSRLLESAAPEICEWMEPETEDVDLGAVERIWNGIGGVDLPQDFNWGRVANTYTLALKKDFKDNPDLREIYAVVLQKRQTAALERLAGIAPKFDIDGYRAFLIESKCNALQLAALHSSTYDRHHKLNLWGIFVEPSARESPPLLEVSPEMMRLLRQEGYLTTPKDSPELAELRKRYSDSPIHPALRILDRERLVVITGDPGSGKTSLLKYRALKWAEIKKGPLPLLVDLKEYVRNRKGLIEYCQSGCEVFQLDGAEIVKLLNKGDAAFYLDGLDEIFDIPIRHAVIEEIAVLAARYTKAPVVVTSRKVGYDPQRLKSAGFLTATLEDFDRQQRERFLDKWYGLVEETKSERRRLNDRLIRALKESSAIREIAGNPLLLTMVAILNRNQELPRDRVELYRESSRVLLHEWDASRALNDPNFLFARQEKESLLREVAGDMQQIEGGLSGNLIDRPSLVYRFRKFLDGLGVRDSYEKALAIVQQLTERNFILAYAGAERFCFVHRSFLEYFCASWFLERLQVKRDLSFEDLKNEIFRRHWGDGKWHEVLRLIVGMVSSDDAGKLIRFLLDQDGKEENLTNLSLAVGCLLEVRNRKGIQSVEQELCRRLITDAMHQEQLSTVSYDDEIKNDTHVVRQSAVRSIGLAWHGANRREWLKASMLFYLDENVQLRAMQELVCAWKVEPDTLPFLRMFVGGTTRSFVPQAILQMVPDSFKNHPETFPWLVDIALSDWRVVLRAQALEELVHGWIERSETLGLVQKVAREDNNRFVRKRAVALLLQHWPLDSEGTQILKDSLGNWSSGKIRAMAITILLRYRRGDPTALSVIQGLATSDADRQVRDSAIGALEVMSHP
jgi:hypothetical protein